MPDDRKILVVDLTGVPANEGVVREVLAMLRRSNIEPEYWDMHPAQCVIIASKVFLESTLRDHHDGEAIKNFPLTMGGLKIIESMDMPPTQILARDHAGRVVAEIKNCYLPEDLKHGSENSTTSKTSTDA